MVGCLGEEDRGRGEGGGEMLCEKNVFIPASGFQASAPTCISAEKFVGHSFFQNPEFRFFLLRSGKKNTTCFFIPGKVHTPFIPDLAGYFLFYSKVGVFLFLQSLIHFLCFFI